ncbi:MAG TPA: hypothetical protein VMA98_03585 [Candidatus Acidoferrales bacterium]|nr:hypothetical protein [Candidatus Acidoferrales bacterium]
MKPVLLAAALATASPAAAPITTVALSYTTPAHGYRSHGDLTYKGTHLLVTALTDAAGDHDIDATIEANGKKFHQEYLFMDGITYAKVGDTWALQTNLPPAYATFLITAGGYPVPAILNSGGRIVKFEGETPCGSSTCSKYVVSAIIKLNEKPTAVIQHILVDRALNELIAIDAKSVDAGGAVLGETHMKFDQFDGIRIPVPAIVSTTTPVCYLSNTTAGAMNLCLYKGMFTSDVYTLTVNGQLALRASEIALANGVTSPVVDGLTVQCSVKKQAVTVDPSVEANLKQSGMSDEQIAAQLGQRETGSDCTVNANGAPVMTQHYEFK